MRTKKRNWLWIPLALLAAISFVCFRKLGSYLMNMRYRSQSVLLAVNGKTLTDKELLARAEQREGITVLSQLLREDLERQFAQKHALIPTPAQVQARMSDMMRLPGVARTIRESAEANKRLRDRVTVELIHKAIITQGVTVSDAEVKEYYAQNVDRHNPYAAYFSPASVTVQVIVTHQQGAADAALQKIKDGFPWVTVAREASVDPSRADGGLLPRIYRGRINGNVVPGLEDALFKMKIGDQQGPTKFGKDWWIVRCLEKTADHTLGFDEVKNDCRIGAMVAKGLPRKAAEIEAQFHQFRKQASIQIKDRRYSAAAATD